jgi:hypothetical protein
MFGSRNNNINAGPAELGLTGGAGKGSVERSAKWRKSFDEILWPKSNEGFIRRGNKQIKKYKV